MNPILRTSLACLVWLAGLGSASASSNWLTLVGDPSDPASDYIQFDPGALTLDAGQATLPVRVSRSKPRTTKDGTVFRSFESVVAVDCSKRTAHFLQAAFFAEPDFKGLPFKTEVFSPLDPRPVEFRLIKEAPRRRMINAACDTAAIRSL